MALKYIKPVIEKVELLTEECLAEGGSTCHTYWGSPQCGKDNPVYYTPGWGQTGCS
ncbi:MAG TPA: hypothetical protein VHT34_00125 [Clostridia bacterium]|nr:hypothetical protein [Clostridia bacterium]